MQNEFTGDLGSLLRDVAGFNGKYGKASLNLQGLTWPAFEVKGLDLQGALFAMVTFQRQRIAGSRFRNCRFEGAGFNGTIFKESEFIECSFDHCTLTAARFEDCRFQGGGFSGCNFRFDEEEPGWTVFANTTFDGALFANTRMDKAGFEKAVIRNGRFEDIEYVDVSFSDCTLHEPRFTGGKFDHLYMGNCLLEKPSFDGPDLQDIQYEASTIVGVAVKPGANLKAFETPSVLFKDSTFDLSGLSGSFGLWGAQDCLIQNMDSKGEFGLGGAYSNVTVKNIQARIIQLNNGGRYDGCRFEGLHARDGYLDKASFKGCLFKDFSAQEFLRMDDSDFQEVVWENARLGPKVEFSAAGTIYAANRPF
ncbi:MAG: Adenylate cyclase [Fibrobacteres bacterium]|nr:Adenylate cyclase [Fibrobacterota bacterium]